MRSPLGPHAILPAREPVRDSPRSHEEHEVPRKGGWNRLGSSSCLSWSSWFNRRLTKQARQSPSFILIVACLAGCGPANETGPASTSEAKATPYSSNAPAHSAAAVPEDVAIPPVPTNPLDPALRTLLETARAGVVTNHPPSAETWGRYGQALDAAQAYPEARVSYSQAARLDPTAARWPHLLGLLELQDEPEAALRHLALAVTNSATTNDAPRLRLAQALVERGRFDEARLHLDSLLGQRSNHPAARLELARIHLAQQQLAPAAEALGPCLTNPYTARPALLLLSQIRAREGQAELASTLARRAAALPKPFDWPDPYLREVQALRPDRAQQAERIQAMLAQRRFVEADAALAKLMESWPDDPEFLLLAGRSLLQQRRCPEAEQRFRAHLRVTPDSLNGQTQLALALLCQQRWADAVQVLETTVAMKPDFAQAHANLGLARSRLGDSAGAIRSYRDALRCSPGDPNPHAALAEELARTGETAEALKQAEQALAIEANHARARALRERLIKR